MTAYTFSCTLSWTVTLGPADRFYVEPALVVTVGPGNHKVTAEMGIEGTLNGNYDSRVAVADAVPVTSLQPNCPLADPTDFIADDDAINNCLLAGGIVVLHAVPGPGYIIAQGLQITQNNTTLIGDGPSIPALLFADAYLRAPLIYSSDTVTNYTISHLTVEGASTDRMWVGDCRTDNYDDRTHGFNMRLGGNHFLVENLGSYEAMCGSGMEMRGSDFVIRHNDVSYNGFQESDGIGAWSDGITVLYCQGRVFENQFTDNTDVDLILGPSNPNYPCRANHNTITHASRYAFAGLMIGFNGGDANHQYSSITDNSVSSNYNLLGFGIMVGEHPWVLQNTASDTGVVKFNSSSGAVVSLAVDGIDQGTVDANTATAAQGNDGFGSCTFSSDYTAADYGTATLQPGFVVHPFHDCQ